MDLKLSKVAKLTSTYIKSTDILMEICLLHKIFRNYRLLSKIGQKEMLKNRESFKFCLIGTFCNSYLPCFLLK